MGGQTPAQCAPESFPGGAQRLRGGGQRRRTGRADVARQDAEHSGGTDARQARSIGITLCRTVDRVRHVAEGRGRVVGQRILSQPWFVPTPCQTTVPSLDRDHRPRGGFGSRRRWRQCQRGRRRVDQREEQIRALSSEAPFNGATQPWDLIQERGGHRQQVRQSTQPQHRAGQCESQTHGGCRGGDRSAHQDGIVAGQAPRLLVGSASSRSAFGVGNDPAHFGQRGAIGIHGHHHPGHGPVQERRPDPARGAYCRQHIGGDRGAVFAAEPSHLDPAAGAVGAGAPCRRPAECLDGRTRGGPSQRSHVRRCRGQ